MLQSEMVMSSQTITHAGKQYYCSLFGAAARGPLKICIVEGLYYDMSIYSV